MAVFFTDKELSAMLTAAGRQLNPCNMEMITLAALAVEAYVGRLGLNVGEQTVVEFLPANPGTSIGSGEGLTEYANRRVTFSEVAVGHESGMIILSRTPVKSITSVYSNIAAWTLGTVGGDWPTETLLPAGTYVADWDGSGVCKSGILRRRLSAWPVEPRTVKVTYVGGWTAVEAMARYPELVPGMRYGIYQWLARDAVAKRMAAGMTGTSFSIEDFSVSLGNQFTGQAGTMAGGLPAIVLPPDLAHTLAGEANLSRWLPI